MSAPPIPFEKIVHLCDNKLGKHDVACPPLRAEGLYPF